MLCKSDALLFLLGVGIGTSSSSATNGVSVQSGLGLGLGVVVEAFSPSYSGIHVCNNRLVKSGRSMPLSSALRAEDASSSSSSADASAEAAAAETTDGDGDGDGDGGGISTEAGGQLTKKGDQQKSPPSSSSSSAGSNSAETLEYQPLQRQWWEGARAAEEAGPSSTGQGFFSTTTDRSRQSQGGITSSISSYAPQKDVQRLQKRQTMQRIAASASVGNGRWHEGAGSSGLYGTQVIGGGAGSGRSNTNAIGGFESDTDKARRERMEKQQMQQQIQAQRAADVAQLASSMAENEDADLNNDNPEVAETIMADMSGSWEVPTPEEVENMQIDENELPEDMVDEKDGEDEVEAAEKSTGKVTGEWAVGADHKMKQTYTSQVNAPVDTPSSPSASASDKPKSQGTVTGEWAVGADHKMKQSRRPPSGGRGFES